MNFNDFTTNQKDAMISAIDPTLIQEIPPVIKREIDRIDCNDKLSDEILTATIKKIEEINVYNLKGKVVEARDIRFTTYWHHGIEFRWRGFQGTIFTTTETVQGATKEGDVRMFFGIPFYASSIYEDIHYEKVGWIKYKYVYKKTIVSWTVPDASDKWISELKQTLFR